ncbi:MAG: DUF1329 domain-containing protein [Deltaproteobacteria bacterium]|nr:DUF1329 domain-containing protein [Deltaproteobacteria bacterium]
MLNNKWKILFGIIIATLFVSTGWISSSFALDGKAGEVIKTVADLKDLQAKGLLFESQVITMSEQLERGIPIPIVETTDQSMDKVNGRTYMEATRKHAGKASLDSEGRLKNYAGQGQPFPEISADDPQAGLKAAYNYDHKDFGDTGLMPSWEYLLTDDKGRIKTLGGISNRISLNYRTAITPTPSLGISDDIWFKDLIAFTKPFSMKNMAQLTIKYMDEARLRDTYIYIPGLRRIVRGGTGNRCDCLGGFVFNMDDSDIWSGDTFRFNWELLEVKEHLVGTLSDYDVTTKGGTYVKGNHLTIMTLERRKMWVIKNSPKFDGYCYSHRIYLMDPENWFYKWEEMYDRSGNLWKILQQLFAVMPIPDQNGGGNIMTNSSGDAIDIKIMEAGPYYHNRISMNDPSIIPEQFTLDAMRRQGR